MRATDEFPAPVRQVTGQVKWFDRGKGYGFIVAPGIESDILLHANVLRNFGQNSVAEGSSVTINVIGTARGMQAAEVVDIEAPLDAPPPPDESAELTAGPFRPARVKWFDRAKGFGFANVFGRTDDVFIHIDVLRRSSLADLQPGEAVAIRVAEGERGCLAMQVALWEAALPEE